MTLEHEQTHPAEWDTVCLSVSGKGAKCESYRRCCSAVSWSGIALSIRAMRAETEWGHNAFLDYVDRWHYEAGSIDEVNKNVMVANYDAVEWAGVEPWLQGDSGTCESAFTAGMWNAYRRQFDRRIFRNVRLHTEVEP